MGRPRKEGMDYFPHDVDASADEKIEAMRSVHGNDGYAFYFIILERIYRSNQAELDISKQVILTTLARKIMVTQNKLKKMIDTSVEIGLFCSENFEKRKILTSDGIKKRFLMINNLRDKWRENKGISPSFLDGKQGGKLVENRVENGVENAVKESKEKESKSKVKEKESKTQYSERVFLFESEYQSLIENYGEAFTKDCIQLLENYKASSGKHYDSDYHAMQSWVITRVTEQMNKPAPTSKPAQKPLVSEKPKMVMATQEALPPDTTAEEFEDWRNIARLLDEGSPKTE